MRGAATLPDEIDPMAPDFLSDPFPLYERLRSDRPMVRLRSGGWLLTRHADIASALTSPALGNAPSRFSALNARHRDTRVAADLANNILPFMDKPEHIRPRRILSRAVLSGLPEFGEAIGEEARTRVAALAGTSRVDVIGDLASPFATSVMCRFLGVDPGEGPRLKALTESFFRLFAPMTDAGAAARIDADLARFRAFVGGLVETAETGLVARLRETEAGGERLSPQEIVDGAILVFADGVENVEAGIASAVSVLGRAAGRGATLGAFAAQEDDAVAEVLRLETPAQIIPRIVRSETVLHGETLKAETPVFLALGSANRDGAVFEAPDRFRIDRDRAPVLTFGAGRHSCIGSGLAAMQISAMVAALAAAGARHEAGPTGYLPRFGHRWPVGVALSLP